MWRNAPAEEKKPYLDSIEANRTENARVNEAWKEAAAEWDQRSLEVKDRWCTENPFDAWVVPSSLDE
ncbi:uncharacterized protein N7483_004356 [Penicillium malachiteum]|uniref:uncharacterized protein n=1 Tax=Penicillium malachiteum TaxID=1324776 RepID=UPI0025495DBA|nr:uncharacterized protein N7483_004356 [Penicillium malachiteum]KAJ5729848.1 hypothetical protein N7483_004356 [Penicillium malachiteum]